MTRPITITFVVATALACMALVYFLRVGWTEAALVAKLVASTAFLATAVSVGALQHRFGRLLFAGLVCSWFGDMFLTGPSQRAFLLGLGSFLLAHIAYATAFISYGQNRKWTMTAAVPVIVCAVLVLWWLGPHLPANLAMPVRVYTAVISLMVITAFGAKGAGASTIIVAGALMFFVSDISVAMQRIVETEFPTIIWGLPLYYSGQLCLALGASHSSSQ